MQTKHETGAAFVEMRTGMVCLARSLLTPLETDFSLLYPKEVLTVCQIQSSLVVEVCHGDRSPGRLVGSRVGGRRRFGPDPKDLQATRDKAVEYLRKHQGDDGSFSPRLGGPGVTALVVAGMLRNGYSADDPMVAKAIAYLEKKVQKDGGIYEKQLANYTTCVAVMAFQEANKGGKYDTLIKNATLFLEGLQVDESKAEKTDPQFRRRRLRWPETTRFVEHHVSPRCLSGGRNSQGRSGGAEGAGIHQPVPEPGRASTITCRLPRRPARMTEAA